MGSCAARRCWLRARPVTAAWSLRPDVPAASRKSLSSASPATGRSRGRLGCGVGSSGGAAAGRTALRRDEGDAARGKLRDPRSRRRRGEPQLRGARRGGGSGLRSGVSGARDGSGGLSPQRERGRGDLHAGERLARRRGRAVSGAATRNIAHPRRSRAAAGSDGERTGTFAIRTGGTAPLAAGASSGASGGIGARPAQGYTDGGGFRGRCSGLVLLRGVG